MFVLSDIWPYLIQVHIYPSPYSLQLLLSQVVPMRVLGFFSIKIILKWCFAIDLIQNVWIYSYPYSFGFGVIL